VEKRNDYIEWMFRLEDVLREHKVEISEYDEFYINDAIQTIENILKQYNNTTSSYYLDDSTIDDYMNNAIKREPSKKDYYETISF